jgi:hypothetical protein
MGDKGNECTILAGKPKGKRRLGILDTGGRIILRWREIGWGGMDWIDLARDRDQWRGVVNTVMNLRVP